MIDENLFSVTPLLNEVGGKVHAATTLDLGLKRGAADELLIEATKTNGHVLLTRGTQSRFAKPGKQ